MAAQDDTEKVSAIANGMINANIKANAPSVTGNSSGPGVLDASKLSYSYTTAPQTPPEPDSREVWAQNVATDHMITAKWTAAGGWEAPALVPYGPLSLMPMASALHYATECFEGMKLYRGYDGAARLFRPDKNASRMLNSAARISLPAFDPAALIELIAALAAVDAPKWLPRSRPGSFLYVRPTLIGTSPCVAVKKPDDALLFVLLVNFPRFDEPGGSLGPPGTYTAADAAKNQSNKKGVRLLASEDDMVRAWPGGFGNSKLGANYGPSLVASAAAAARGYDQILWLFGQEGWVTEVGASNFFAVVKDKASGRTQLWTAPLEDQIILPGITRMSVLELARTEMADELDVIERRYTIHELLEAADEGRLVECFAGGTAFFISAVGEIHYRGRDVDVPLAEGLFGAVAKKVRDRLRAIMYGNDGETDHPWGYKIKETGF